MDKRVLVVAALSLSPSTEMPIYDVLAEERKHKSVKDQALFLAKINNIPKTDVFGKDSRSKPKKRRLKRKCRC